MSVHINKTISYKATEKYLPHIQSLSNLLWLESHFYFSVPVGPSNRDYPLKVNFICKIKRKVSM